MLFFHRSPFLKLITAPLLAFYLGKLSSGLFFAKPLASGERFQRPNSRTSFEEEILPGLQLLLVVGWWWQQEPRDGELFGDSNIFQVLTRSRDFLRRQRFLPRCCCSAPSTQHRSK